MLSRAGKFPDALREYSEAIKRNPEDPKPYSNRAACYMKLAEWSLALEVRVGVWRLVFEGAISLSTTFSCTAQDCNTCVAKDPTFVKGFLRKGNVLLAMQRFNEARDVFRDVLEMDADNAEAKQGLQKVGVFIFFLFSVVFVQRHRFLLLDISSFRVVLYLNTKNNHRRLWARASCRPRRSASAR